MISGAEPVYSYNQAKNALKSYNDALASGDEKKMEEDKKADEAYKKSVYDYREGRQKRLLELETARIKKANKKSKKTVRRSSSK